MSISILKKCSGCKKRRLLVMHRTYKLQKVGLVTSEGQLCGKCYRAITRAVKHQLQ